jgi:hypothetical protein
LYKDNLALCDRSQPVAHPVLLCLTGGHLQPYLVLQGIELYKDNLALYLMACS